MKLPTDPRLPILGGPDYDRSLYSRLYELFRQYAQAINGAGPADATEGEKGIAALASQAEVNATSSQNAEKIVTPKTLWGWVKQATESILGMAKVATQTQTNAGTDDATFITPKKLRFGVAYSLTRTGYLILPQWLGGFIFQWGEGNAVNADIGITWPTPFTGTPYFVLASCTTAQSVAVVASATDYSTTGSSLRFRNSAGGVNGMWYSYFAVGR